MINKFVMTLDELKKLNEVFFAVKGHLFPVTYSTNEMRSVYESYFSRLWGNHERLVNSNADFEDIWNNRTTWLTPLFEIDDDDDDDISRVAHLGYD
jgi:hypothetical protein